MDAANKYSENYRQAKPFPHIVIDSLVPDQVLDHVLGEFPKPSEITWIQHVHTHSQKLASGDETQLGDFTRSLIAQLNSSQFLCFLEELTGISGLIPDPYLEGGGLHQIERGGFLSIHADFNYHEKLRLDRRLNVLLFLNKDWKEEYGGHLELWNRDVTKCEKQILPLLNRMVIFNTTDFSFHGHPDRLDCPKGQTRKSIALYYYTNGRPSEEASDPHSTLYQSRSEGKMQLAFSLRVKTVLQQLMPPILVALVKRIRK